MTVFTEAHNLNTWDIDLKSGFEMGGNFEINNPFIKVLRFPLRII